MTITAQPNPNRCPPHPGEVIDDLLADLDYSQRAIAKTLNISRQQLHAILATRKRVSPDMAARLGKPGGARAVGRANALNPLAIVLPCHRVIGKDGSLTGFAGGIDKKRWLLAHEARNPRGLFVGPARSPARSGSSAPKRP